MKKLSNKIILGIIVVITVLLIIGVAIPKLTVRSAITLSSADAQCVQAGVKQQLNHPLERAALFLGKSAVVGVQDKSLSGGIPIQISNTFVVKSYTLFRIPLPVNEKLNRNTLHVDCNVVPEQIDEIERPEVLLYEGDDIIEGYLVPLEQPTRTKEHAYIKRYDYDNSTLWYVVNQQGQLPYTEPLIAVGTLITELDGKTASVVSESSFQNPPKNASVFLRVYDRKINTPQIALIALSSSGEVLGTQTTPINKNYYNTDKYDIGYISNSDRLYIACSLNGNLVVLDQDEKIVNQSKEFRCSRSRAMRALSHDGTTVFYTEGLYEAYGLGEEDLMLARNESKKLRAFSFTTGTSTVVAEEGGWFLYNSKNINTTSGIYSQPIRRKAPDNAEYTRGFTFYQLPANAFEFLTYEEVSKLPEINSFNLDKKWHIDEIRFTPNGKILVFGARSTMQGSAHKETFGFYDIYKDELIFPISIKDGIDSARLWQAPDKDSAFIMTSRRGENRKGIGGETAMYIAELYHIRRDGTATFIDSIPNLDGTISLLGT